MQKELLSAFHCWAMILASNLVVIRLWIMLN